MEGFLDARVVIVDDTSANVALLEAILQHEGYTDVTGLTDSSAAVRACTEHPPDVLLLDLRMPRPDGYEVMERLRPAYRDGWLPVIVLSADATPEARQRALACGARDFVTKPFDRMEVVLRIRNVLETRALQSELRQHNATLESQVAARTRALADARLEVLERLALAAEYRDDDTGEHTQRVGRTAALVARALELSHDEVALVRYAATLHDIGKVGIPDHVLLKPGKLTDEEFELVKRHAAIGADIMSGSSSPLLQMGEVIARTHHERWDGRGYPSGLAGDAIPLPGRIAAVADVFDALTHTRPYKEAWPVERALEEIVSLAGQQFDPQVVDAFESLDHEALLSPVEGGARSLGPSGDGSAGPLDPLVLNQLLFVT